VLDAVWAYLRLDGGRTAASMFADIERLRRLGIKREDLPSSREGFIACLEALQADGRASKTGQVWIPEYPEPVKVERREPQTTLF
jgi:hypothetical protein